MCLNLISCFEKFVRSFIELVCIMMNDNMHIDLFYLNQTFASIPRFYLLIFKGVDMKWPRFFLVEQDRKTLHGVVPVRVVMLFSSCIIRGLFRLSTNVKCNKYIDKFYKQKAKPKFNWYSRQNFPLENETNRMTIDTPINSDTTSTKHQRRVR